MKKILIVSVSGILIGTAFAIYMFSNLNNEIIPVMQESNEITAFQVGVYSIYDNAKRVADSYSNSYIYKDEDKFRVFLAIYQDQEIIDYMANYYKNNNIEVYLKKMNGNKYFLEELNKYEKLLKETSDKSTFVNANKNILGAFEKSL